MDKVQKKGEPTALEQQVSCALAEITAQFEEPKKKLGSSLKISGVKEIIADGGRVLIVSVPYKQIDVFRSVQTTVVPDLEKKLSAQIVLVGQRRAFPKTPVHKRRYQAVRSTGRTLRAVQEAFLEDVCYPTTIIGKRIHYNEKGTQKTLVFLDPHDHTRVEDRLSGFAAAYLRLTGLKTVFQVGGH
jgi:small subunit ribosomal protein S7e